MINDMKIACDTSGAYVDDLSISIENDFLMLSPRVFAAFTRNNCRTAFAVMSFVKAFPNATITIFGWTDEAFAKFKNNLWAFQPIVDPDLHLDRPPMKVSYGALRPIKKD
jgi:hypothetical protein